MLKEVLVEVGSSKNLVKFESSWVASDKTIVKQKVGGLVQKNAYLQTLIKPDTLYLLQMYSSEYDCYVDISESDQIPHKAKLLVVVPEITDAEAMPGSSNVQTENGTTGAKRRFEEEEEYDEGVQYVPEDQVEEMVKQGYVVAPEYAEGPEAYGPHGMPPRPYGYPDFAGGPRGPMFRGPPHLGQGYGPPPMQRPRMDYPGGYDPYYGPPRTQPWLQLMEFEAEDLDLARKETPQTRKIYDAAYVIGDSQPVQLLNEFCQRKNWERPRFELIIDGTHRKEPTYKFKVDVRGRTIEADRHSKSKKQAKVYAAIKALYVYKALF